MTRDELDWRWQRALNESVQDGEKYIRYHFAALVAAHEREECAKFLEGSVDLAGLLCKPAMLKYTKDLMLACAAAIRARGDT